MRFAAAGHPAGVERLYARGVYPVVVRVVSALTGWVPFSLAEALLALLVVGAIVLLVLAVRALFRRGGRLRRVVDGAAGLALALGLALAAFDLLWGLNYDREPVAVLRGLGPVGAVPAGELEALASDLLADAARIRAGLPEDAQGALRLTDGIRGALRRAARAYDALDLDGLPTPAATGHPKPVALSALMSYLGIGGIFIPFTSEPNVNVTLPDWEIPFTACHEAAHQRGFAREDEANYVSYRACLRHPDPDFRYSGTFRAGLYVLGALGGADRERYARLRQGLDPALLRDLAALAAWRLRYQSRLAEVQDRVNDRYLKTQGQREGVRSYGRMVDLLVAERRAAARNGAPPTR